VASSEFVAFGTRLSELRACFIVELEPPTGWTQNHHRQALAYRLLASSELEHYVESRCISICRGAIDRAKKQLSSSSGFALLVWFATQNSKGAIPISRLHLAAWLQEADKVVIAYEKLVKRSHGISGDDLRRLLWPLGVQEGDIDSQLSDRLDELANLRNPAAHTHVNRARSMTEPKTEAERLESIRALLAPLDARLDHYLANDP